MNNRFTAVGAGLWFLAGGAFAADCPPITVADMMGVPAGQHPQEYELAEFEELAGCTLTFQENPAIADLNAQIVGNPALPPLAERLHRAVVRGGGGGAGERRDQQEAEKPVAKRSHGAGVSYAATSMAETAILPNFIGGSYLVPSATETVPVFNPATGEVLSRIPLSGAEDVGRAVASAKDALRDWRETPPTDRVQPLFRLKALLERDFEELSRCVTTECGKTLAESRGEMRRAIENVEVACGIPSLMQGRVLEDIARGIDELMIRQPVGVVAVIAPFNFPAMIPFWFLPYALACGNTVVMKPSEKTPLTMQRVVALIEEAGFPAGVVQVTHGGQEAVEALRSGAPELTDTDSWAPQVRIRVPSLIPDDYVADLGVRLTLYRRLAALRDDEELTAFGDELEDRFGDLPEETRNLLRVMAIRLRCRRSGIERLTAGGGGLTATFRRGRAAAPEALLDWVARTPEAAVLDPASIRVRAEWIGARKILGGTFRVADEIARLTDEGEAGGERVD